MDSLALWRLIEADGLSITLGKECEKLKMAGVNKLSGTELQLWLLIFQAVSTSRSCIRHATVILSSQVHTKHLSAARPFVGTGGAEGMKTAQHSKSESYLVTPLEFWFDVSVLNDSAQILTAQRNFFLPFPLIFFWSPNSFHLAVIISQVC